MELSVVAVAALWLPLAVLITALLAYGIRRDRGRSTKPAVAVAAACVLVLTATAALTGWIAYKQQRADQDACTPRTDC